MEKGQSLTDWLFTGCRCTALYGQSITSRTPYAYPVVALLGPAHTVDFEFHLTDWLSSSTSTATHPVLPEVQKLSATKMLCVYGEEEADTLCKDLDPQRATIIRLKGGHHFEGDYNALAEAVLQKGR